MTSIKQFQSAIRTIGASFYEPEERISKDGEVYEYNLLGYTQRQILQTICWKLDQERIATADRLEEAKRDARKAAREHRGDEISEQTTLKALAWVKRMSLQLDCLETSLDAASAVYTEVTGRTYKRSADAKAMKVAVNEAGMTPAQIEAMALLGEANEAENGGGVDAAEAEGVA